MAEAAQGAPEAGFVMGGGLEALNGQNQPEAPVEEPGLPDDWQDVLANEETPAPSNEDNAEDPTVEGDLAGQPSLEDLRVRNARLETALQLVANQTGNGKGTPGPEQAASAVDSYIDGRQDVPEETRTYLKGLGKVAAEEAAAPLMARIQQLETTQNDQRGEQVLSKFEGELDSMFVDAGLTDTEKKLFGAAVKMEGLQKYGNTFTADLARRVFREIHGQHLRERQSHDDNDVERTQQVRQAAPPPTARGGNQSAQESVLKTMHTSRAKNVDFKGSDWRRYIRSKVARLSGEGG
jgi:hypothetical protein